MKDLIQIIAAPHPFLTERVDAVAEAGGSLADVLDRSGLRFPAAIDARICVNDLVIPKEEWENFRPSAGDIVSVRAIPRGGGGGKNILRVVMTIALIAAMPYAGWTAGWAAQGIGIGSMAAEGIALGSKMVLMVGGMALINSVCPPPATSVRKNDNTENTQSYGIEGAQNQYAPWNPIPSILGKHRFTPPYAAKPYTEINGNDQYLHALFCVGHGPLEITDPKIGDTDLTAFQVGDDPEDRLAFEIWPCFNPATDTLQYFRDDCTELTLSLELKQADGWQTRQTEADIDEIGVDVSAPQGMVEFESDGDKKECVVDFTIEYKKTTDSTWSVSRGGQAFAQRNSGTIEQPNPFPVRSGNHQDGYTDTTVTGYSYIILGIDKTSGEIKQYFRRVLNRSSGQPQSFQTAAQAKRNCQRPPDHVAILCGITRASNKAAIDTGDIDNTMRSADLDCLNSSDFLVSATATPGNTVDIAAGTLYFRPQMRGTTNNAIRRTYRFAVSKGTYDVRIRRETADSTSDKVFDDIYWTCLRSFKSANPITLAGLALVEMRVKASDQLNGTINNFNCVAYSRLPDWNGSAWVTRTTNNPASLFRAVFQGPANKKPAPDSKLNLTDLQAWHEECTARGYTFNQPIDYQSTVQEIAQNIAAAGRASLAMRDGKFTVIQDKARTTIVQHFTPHNSWGFKSSKNLITIPHGFRVRFPDEDADWQSAERIVYADGYTEANAAVFEEMQLPGITDSDLAWMHGRYHLAQLLLRPEEYTFQVDIENLVCTRGDLIRVAHDVPLWGLSTGRISSVAPNYVQNGLFGTFSRYPKCTAPDHWISRLKITSQGIYGTVDRYLDSVLGGGAGVILTADSSGYSYLQQWLGSNYGSNLVVNGDAELESNANFHQLTYTEEDSFNGKGCFKKTTTAAGAEIRSDELLEIDTSKSYMVGAALKTTLANSTGYIGVICFDEDGVEISAARSWRYQNRNTTLYAPLTSGATYVDIVPAAEAWGSGGANYYIQLDIATDGSDLPFSQARMVRLSGTIDTSPGTYWRVYLSSAYSGSTYAVGTNVGQTLSTGGWNYTGFSGSVVGTEWVYQEGPICGISALYEQPVYGKFRYGTKFIKFMAYPAYNQVDTIFIGNISIRQFDNPASSLIGQTVTTGAWVHCTTANRVRLYITDNVSYTGSSFHTGSGWEWLTVSRTIPSGAYYVHTQLVVGMNGAATAIFSNVLTTTGISAITLDETVSMESGKSYGVRIRKTEGTSIAAAVSTVPGDTNSLTLSAPLAISTFPPSKGDLVMFGESSHESVELLVKSITPGSDLTATITAVDYSPAVYNADTGTIPAFDPGISLPPAPHAPLILNCRSNEFVMVRQKNGTWIVRMLVTLGHPSNTRMHDVSRIEGQFRVHGSVGSWIKLPQIPRDATEVSIYDVETGVTYEIRFRYVFKNGTMGPWTSYYEHTVVGKSGLPSDVAFDDANCVFQSNRLTFRWLPIPDPDLDFYELRTDTNWGQTAGMLTRTQATKYVYLNPPDDDTTYYIKACDTSGNYSANADSITPSTDSLGVGTVSTDFTTENLQIFWAAVDSQILDYYTVAIYSDSGHNNLIHTSGQFINPHYEFTFAMNNACTGGPYREVWIRVTAHDIYGRAGYSDGYAINAAPAQITSLEVIPVINGLLIMCENLSGDVIGYEFACDTDNPPTASKEIGNNFISWDGLAGGVVHYVRARAKDIFGFGSWSSVTSATPETLIIGESAFDVPLTIGANWRYNASSQLEWDAHKVIYGSNEYSIAAGTTTDMFVIWNRTNPTVYTTGSSVTVSTDIWVMCMLSGGVVYPAQQGKLIHGGYVQVNTLNADRIITSTMTLSRITGTGTLSIGTSGVLTIASGGALNVTAGKISVSAAAGIELTSTGGINCLAGSDISLNGSASDPAKLILKGSSYNTEIYVDGVGQYLNLVPNNYSGVTLCLGRDYTGSAPYPFYNIYGYCLNVLQFFAEYASDSTRYAGIKGFGNTSTPYTEITAHFNASYYAYVRAMAGSGAQQINMRGAIIDDGGGFNGCRIKLMTYTGNGSTSGQSITGAGFTPKYIRVWPRVSSGGSVEFFSKHSIESASTFYEMESDVHYKHDSASTGRGIVSLDSDGFTVKGTGNPNTSGQVYEVLVLG